MVTPVMILGLLVVGLLVASPTLAEPEPGEIDVERIVRSHPDMPPRGASMDRVRSALGEPSEVNDAVGDPPITRWIYDDFTVFFEHERVLHSVRPQRAGN